MTRILHLEDDPRDSEIIRELFLSSSLACQFKVVADREEYLCALREESFDVILSDFRLPSFDGLTALQLAREHAPDTPFIIVAGNLGEEFAVELLKQGATDFVLKDRPLRLVSSVERALGEAAEARARRLAEDNAAAAGRRYRALYDENPSIYFTLDTEGTIRSVNRFGAQQLGYERESLIGHPFTELFYEADRGAAARFLADTLDMGEQVHRCELRKLTKRGALLWMRDTARVTRGEDGTPMVLIVAEDTTEAWELSKELHYRTTHDEVTQLFNRREFERRLKSALEERLRDPASHCLCYVDLDRFRVVNDNCGHLAGDELLRQVTARLKSIFPRHDVLARVGSDEFAVLLMHCLSDEAHKTAAHFLDQIRNMEFEWGGRRFPSGASVGIFSLSDGLFDHQAAMAAVETACQMAKETGGNRIHIYSEADHATLQHVGDSRWVPRINEALSSNRFFLEYQTIAPLRAELPSGEHMELLLRLRDPDGQVISPGQFLPAAERYNLCAMIDEWVVREALRWLSLPTTPLDRVGWCSVNLSARSLVDAQFQGRLRRLLASASVLTHKLCFEITETAAITNIEQAIRFVTAVKAFGCKFALDDFGSGMASFAYLKHFPVDAVKIDGLFVRDILSDPFSFAMVRSICEVARAGHMITVAEFAADREIVECLRKIGVDYAQGYGIARPAPLARFGTNM